ncbi:hypothetical protein BGX27_006571, partial [Mortierella sp. AM989]
AASASALTSAKPKSPSDLFNLMKAKQQAARSSVLTDQMVTMDNLESTLAGMTASRTARAPVIEKVTKSEPVPLKSALKPPPKKVSLFKQMRDQSEAVDPIKETPVAAASTVVESKATLDAQEIPTKKMSKFARDRAAAASSATVPTTQKSAASLEKPAVGGISEQVFERNIVASSAPRKTTTPGVFEVVERNVPTKPIKENGADEPQAITGIKD